jgi:hypothetical protein
VPMCSQDYLSWSLSRELSNSAMANTTNRTSAAVLSTHTDIIRDEGSHGFRLRLFVRQTSPEIGIPTGSM